MRVNNRGVERARHVRHVAEDGLRDRHRHADVGHGLRHARGNADRRPVRLPAAGGLRAVPVLRLRPGAAPVPGRRGREPGAALDVAGRRAPALDRRAPTSSRPTASSPPATCSTWRPARCPRSSARRCRCSTRSSPSWPTSRTTWPGRCSATSNFGITDQLEADVALRYDSDERENTTRTPEEFIPGPLQGEAFPGQVRTETWDEWQPKFTLRYKPNDDVMMYAGYSRGFRSGGFNQTGVGAAGIAGIERPVRQGDRGHVRGGHQGAALGRAAVDQLHRLPHQGGGLVLLRVRPEHQHPEPGQPGGGRVHRLRGRGAVARHRLARAVRARRLHRQRDQGVEPRSRRRRQPGAAGVRVHHQPGRA